MPSLSERQQQQHVTQAKLTAWALLLPDQRTVRSPGDVLALAVCIAHEFVYSQCYSLCSFNLITAGACCQSMEFPSLRPR